MKFLSLFFALTCLTCKMHAEHTHVHQTNCNADHCLADKGYFPGGDESALPQLGDDTDATDDSTQSSGGDNIPSSKKATPPKPQAGKGQFPPEQ